MQAPNGLADSSAVGDAARHASYFAELTKISRAGRIYKRFFASPILFFFARRFGPRVLEVGCGIGSGVLGAYPRQVQGLDVNPLAVGHCAGRGLDARLIQDSHFPVADGAYDACVLDNVLEHIDDARLALNECHRVTAPAGGLVIAVPGLRGYAADADHRQFYGAPELEELDAKWRMQSLFSIPFLLKSERLSRGIRQYCLVATYRKNID
jgi:SAM-dependent methyltransferase